MSIDREKLSAATAAKLAADFETLTGRNPHVGFHLSSIKDPSEMATKFDEPFKSLNQVMDELLTTETKPAAPRLASGSPLTVSIEMKKATEGIMTAAWKAYEAEVEAKAAEYVPDDSLPLGTTVRQLVGSKYESDALVDLTTYDENIPLSLLEEFADTTSVWDDGPASVTALDGVLYVEMAEDYFDEEYEIAFAIGQYFNPGSFTEGIKADTPEEWVNKLLQKTHAQTLYEIRKARFVITDALGLDDVEIRLNPFFDPEEISEKMLKGIENAEKMGMRK